MTALTSHRTGHLFDERSVVLTCRCDQSHPWVRELPLTTLSHVERPFIPGDWHLVGFSVTNRRPGMLHRRRYWVVKPDDAAVYGPNDWPREAVDPASIRPAQPSRSMGNPREACR